MHRVLFFLLAASVLNGIAIQTDLKTVWTGVYTAHQAERGRVAFEQHCISCHKGNDQPVNPESRLRGEQFMKRWREDSIESLFALIKATMPRNNAGKLPDSTYIDVISYLFLQNGFPAGEQELTASTLKTIQIEEKDGPKPLPHGALAQLVGCLSQGDDVWLLVRASEPTRTPIPGRSTEEELKAAETQALGTLRFRLQNIEAAEGEFRVLAHTGHTLHVKGYLILQPGRERINVTSVQSISPTCGPGRS
ncbi:MAG: c-type cytochrome [Acidobacteria bacterium]|nr:c-type cytochrome [Acidobacteriota bacterium]